MNIETEIGKEKIRFNFHTYDLFLFLIPAIVFFTSVYLFEFLLHLYVNSLVNEKFHLHLPIFYGLSNALIPIMNNWFLLVISFIIVIIYLFAFGHIIASLANFYILRILIRRGFRYPYSILFKISPTSPRKYKMNLTRVSHISSIFLITFIYIYNLLSFSKAALEIYKISLGAMFFVFVLHILIKSLKEKQKELNKLLKIILNNIFVSLLKLSNSFLYILRDFLNIARPFSKDLIDIYNKNFKKVFKFDYKKIGSENYWFTRIYLEYKAPDLYNRINYWYNQQEYTLNISMAFFLAFIYCFFNMLINIDEFNIIFKMVSEHSKYRMIIVRAFPLVYFLAANLMLIRFFNIYYNYYSQLLFRSFIVITKISNKI